MIRRPAFRYLANPQHGTPDAEILSADGFHRAKQTISSWDGYAPTPLHDLPAIAASAGVAVVRLKDESARFGLGSFKALGGAYAVAKLVADRAGAATPRLTVTCATDGNHGRSVAWAAARFGCDCVIFVHEAVSAARVAAIAAFGAEIRHVSGNYDDAVRMAERTAKAEGWVVVSDTSYPGYTDVPAIVMQGYRLMADEAADHWQGAPPTHVFMQAGVGGAAAAVSVQMRARFDPPPALIVVEPERAACLQLSAERGEVSAVGGDLATIMAGLSCGEPSLLAWQELRRSAAGFMAIPDAAAENAMRLLAEEGLVVGESGVAGLAGLQLVSDDSKCREVCGLGLESRILLFGTEGATDADAYKQIVCSR